MRTALSPSQTRRGRVPELDGLRGIAILQVVLAHYFYNPSPKLPGLLRCIQYVFGLGWTGVDLFFVLSGFLIGGILLDERSSPAFFKTFYIRRFFRIIPLYYLWLILFIVFIYFGGPTILSHTRLAVLPRIDWSILAHFLFLQNLWAFDFVNLAYSWLAPLWSLAVEEQFYLISPLLIWFLPKRRLVVVLWAVVVLAPFCRILVRHLVPYQPWPAYRLMPCRADCLALGMLIANYWRDEQFRARLSARGTIFYSLLAVLLAGVVVLGIWFSNPIGLLTQTIGYSWIAFFYAFLLIAVLKDIRSPLARLARIRWLQEAGRVSYCMYIIHSMVGYFCFGFLMNHFIHLTRWRNGTVGLLAISLTYCIAKLSWICLEYPLLRIGHRYTY